MGTPSAGDIAKYTIEGVVAAATAVALIFGFVSCNKADEANLAATSANVQASIANDIAQKALDAQLNEYRASAASDAAHVTASLGDKGYLHGSDGIKYDISVRNASDRPMSNVIVEFAVCPSAAPDCQMYHDKDLQYAQVGDLAPCARTDYYIQGLDRTPDGAFVYWTDAAGNTWKADSFGNLPLLRTWGVPGGSPYPGQVQAGTMPYDEVVGPSKKPTVLIGEVEHLPDGSC